MPNSKDFNHFDYNPVDINIDRSLFNMDHSIKFSCNVGDVIPFSCIECLPGDTWNIDVSRVVRLQPLVTPIMDEVIQDIYWFFVPMRLVWNHAKEFFGENNSSPWAPSTKYSIPQIYPPMIAGEGTETTDDDEYGWNVGTIADYLGVPPLTDSFGSVSALPFRAYALICDQWFRSEAVMNPVNVSYGDVAVTGSNGNDQTLDIQLGGKPFVACKFTDRFTTALPSPQRGDASNVFPFNAFAPVVALNTSGQEHYNAPKHPCAVGTAPGYFSSVEIGARSTNSATPVSNYKNIRGLFNSATATLGIGPTEEVTLLASNALFTNLYTQLGNTSFNVNDLRTAFAVQRYLERSARYGGRYTEFVKGFFGISSPDARLQRTEYLGGSRLSLNINQVTQNSATESGLTPLGNVAGMSVTGDVSNDVNYSCTEHGFIIGCSVLRYHHSYQQGLQKMWLRKNFEDFYLPTFAFLGEEPVYLKELYNWNTIDTEEGINYSDTVFGYQERWSAYRYLPNRVAGMMRTISNTSLDVWHLGDFYQDFPTLSPEWLREDKSMLDRCLAVTSSQADQCICDFFVDAKAARPLPLYSIPGLIDHY